MALVTGGLIVGGGLVGAAALGTIGAGALYYKYRKMEKRRLSKVAEAGLFGGLLDTIDAKYMDDETGIPRIVQEIFTQIESSGITTHNIFHATGNIQNIKRLQRLYNEGKTNEIHVFEENTHDLCGLVIHYLQRLPEPLCTLLLYSDFLQIHQSTQENREEWVKKIKELFQLLPELNRRLFQRVLEFFDNVAAESENNISHSYLAYLLGPILFYDRVEGDEEEGEPVQLQYNGEIVFDLLMQLFQFHSEIFPVPLKELPPWDATRKNDSDKRRNSISDDSKAAAALLPEISSSDMIDHENTDELLLTSTETSKVNSSPQRRRKRDVLKGLSFSKLKKQYNGELEELPPSINTMPVNYTIPNR